MAFLPEKDTAPQFKMCLCIKGPTMPRMTGLSQDRCRKAVWESRVWRQVRGKGVPGCWVGEYTDQPLTWG